MATNSSKRTRTANFTTAEKFKIVDLVDDWKMDVENKRVDSHSLKCKDAAWQEITNCFNADSFTPRPKDSLKNLWENMKRFAKKRLAQIEVSTEERTAEDMKLDLLVGKVKSIISVYDGSLVNGATSESNPVSDSPIEFVQSTPELHLEWIEPPTVPPSEGPARVSKTWSYKNNWQRRKRPLPKKFINERLIEEKLKLTKVLREEAEEQAEMKKELLRVKLEHEKTLLEIAKIDLQLKQKLLEKVE